MSDIVVTPVEIDRLIDRMQKLHQDMNDGEDETGFAEELSPMAEEHYMSALLHLSLAIHALRLAKLNFERTQ